MDVPFWPLLIAVFIGSTAGRLLFRIHKQRAKAREQQPGAPGGQTMKTHLRTLAFSAAAGLLAVALLALLGGPPPSHTLAQHLRLGDGYVLAAVLGGLLGLWLALGGRKRIPGFGGWLLGLLAAWLLWRFGAPHTGLIELVLTSAFGTAAAAYTGVIAFMLLFTAMRLGAAKGKQALATLLDLGQRWLARRQAAAAVAIATNQRSLVD